jgi:hypothetical protein
MSEAPSAEATTEMSASDAVKPSEVAAAVAKGVKRECGSATERESPVPAKLAKTVHAQGPDSDAPNIDEGVYSSAKNGVAASVKDPEPTSKLEQDIIKQIEFGFSDANLSRDKFLQDLIQQDHGWVSLTALTNVERLARLSMDHAVITGAIRKSVTGIMEVNGDGSKIRRDPETTRKAWKELYSRTLYLKGFPVEADMDTVRKFLDDRVVEYEKVIYRRERAGDAKGKFKGSVFTIFKTYEQAMEFLVKYKTAGILSSHRAL